MNRLLLKIPALFLAVLLAAPAPSLALAPVAVAAGAALSAAELYALGASVTLHVAGIAYFVKQAFFPGSTAGNGKVAPNGDIGRGATVQWVDMTGEFPTIQQAAVTIKARQDKIKEAVEGNPGKYPNLENALKHSPVQSDPQLMKQGDVIQVNGLYYSLGPQTSSQNFSGVCPPIVNVGSTHISIKKRIGDHGGGCADGSAAFNATVVYHTYTALPSAPSPTPATPEQFAQKVANASSPITSPQDVFSDYYQDIDQYIKDYPGNVSVIDGPPSAMNTAPLATLPKAATQAGVTNKELQAAASASRQSAAASAQGSVGTAQSNYNANPTPENEQKLRDAQRELDRVLKDNAEKDAEDARRDAEDEENDERLKDSGFSSDPYGDADAIFDFGARFQSFFDQMKQTSVFSLPNQFFAGIPSGGTSEISFDGGQYGHHSYDFAFLNPVFAVLRTIILVVFAWLSIRIVLLKGSS